ncbi:MULTISPECIES: VWA domain-containing protein [unclassified Caballeronia]|uniref:TadE/TadG family type IV pilus assembly protein n=1 Tax=unclassified Caballeronia TaxID=2646786 RepID=UPI00286590DF|nr:MULTISPECIES: VWA domain-containing protein [unclassified Caballeronia]MDR5754716.1 VWA domain-containing protein [Caballeronia sp. LZ024]MDR5839782.1 VWA domain-containing protein [Caballeronia sp. LZ031]
MMRSTDMTPRRRFKPEGRGAAALVKGEEGAVTMILAVCASMMIGAMCTALDTIHYEMTQARMQMALDVATLSAGADLSHYASTSGSDLANWQKDARAYYDANMPKGYLDLVMPDNKFSATVSGTPAAGQTIRLSASGSMPLLAPVFFGTNTTGSGSGSGSGSGNTPDVSTVTASNAALRLPKSTLELVLVLDNTGSMADYASSDKTQGTKIAGLRTAAARLVANILGQSGHDSYIGLVPFTTLVNVKGALQSGGTWMTPKFTYNPKNVSMAPDSTITQSGWGGCAVEPRDASGNLYPKAYAPKDIPAFTPFYYNVPKAGFTVTTYDNSTKCNVTGTTSFMGGPLSYQTNGSLTYCSTKNGSTIANLWGQPKTDKPTITTLYQNGNTNSTGTMNGPCGIQPAKFLTQDSTALTTAINKMQASGSTIIPTGLLWGWRMLSSDWSDNVAGAGNGWISTDTSMPRPETTQALQRVAIVLTDGQNDPGSASGIMPMPSFNGLSGVGNNVLQAPTLKRTNGTSLVNGSMSSVTDINAFQLGVCTAMKNAGIVVYAITFGADASSGVAQQVMQNCASPGDYFHAPTNDDLDAIFQQIAGNLGVLRLTQ